MNIDMEDGIPAVEFMRKTMGHLTVGRLIRAYRTSNDLSQDQLARKLKVTKGFLSNVETGKKKISLNKSLEIARKLKDHEDLYAQIWFEEEAREAELDVEITVRKRA